MKILLAPDSFKDSLSAAKVCQALEKGIHQALSNAEIISMPLADGGEGTIETLVRSREGHIINVEVHDPLARKTQSSYGIVANTAIIEMAKASGLELLTPEERNPLKTSTFGTGEMIRDALDRGCRDFIIGIGGSATNDGGTGMLQALGIKFLDDEGKEIQARGEMLSEIEAMYTTNLDARIKQSKIQVACDVTNPLLGENGASKVFARQKGADDQMIEILENGLIHFSEKTFELIGKDVSKVTGAGAAGGLGFGLMAYLGAELKSGFDIISEKVRLEEEIQKADLIITGEGKIDEQSRFGKVPWSVSQLGKKYNKPVICIAGQKGKVTEIEEDFEGIYCLMNEGMDIEFAKENAARLLEEKITKVLSKTCQVYYS